ncbi:MAG: ABC transporter permease [Alphaproteobacteria bacterium]
MESWRKSLGVFSVLTSISGGWLLLFFLVPLLIIWFYSFGENVTRVDIAITWTLSNYQRIFDPAIMTLFWRSLWIAGITTIICLIVGFPVALVIATAPSKWKPWLLLVIILPFWTNLLIRTYALLNILGARGRLNDVFRWIWEKCNALLNLVGLEQYALLGDRFVPVKFLGSQLGVVYGMVYIFLPFAVLPIYSALERLDKSYLEASLDLGHGQIGTFFRVLVPLSMSGIIAAAIITFIPALGQFLTPDLLGRGQVDMLANVIERQFKKANDWPFGSALSLFLLYLTFIILAAKSLLELSAAKKREKKA